MGISDTFIQRIGLEGQRHAYGLDNQIPLLVAIGWLEQGPVLRIKAQLKMEIAIVLDATRIDHSRDADA
jgi:hypothetical protein